MDLIPALALIVALAALLYVRHVRRNQTKAIQVCLNELHSIQWAISRGIPADMSRKHLISAQTKCQEVSNRISNLIAKLDRL